MPSENSRTLYEHPDGMYLSIDGHTMTATDEKGSATINIGPAGLLKLGSELVQIGAQRLAEWEWRGEV
jgi:hypothetical protein